MKKRRFLIAFWGIVVAIVTLFVFYRRIFNGDFSTESADWGDFGDFIGGVGTLFFTGLNVWIFYELTKYINHNSTKIEIQQMVFKTLEQLVTPLIRNHPKYSNSILGPLKELYFYINWTNYTNIFSKELEEERVKICNLIRPILGINEEEEPLDSKNVRRTDDAWIDLRGELISFISLFPNIIMEKLLNEE